MAPLISVPCTPALSAIYYALLQRGYEPEYYAVGKPPELAAEVAAFRRAAPDIDLAFFSQVRQSTCQVYPYWPRAALLETAVFYLEADYTRFAAFDGYRRQVMAAPNLAPEERDDAFWRWVSGFPPALAGVLASRVFQDYLRWEQRWLAARREALAPEIERLANLLGTCVNAYRVPLQQVSLFLSPIKCAWSSDHHWDGPCFWFSSGRFQPDSVVHEYLHRVVHPALAGYRDKILSLRAPLPGIDPSYYLSGGPEGSLNAFEEYAVRALTQKVSAGSFPDLSRFLEGLWAGLPPSAPL